MPRKTRRRGRRKPSTRSGKGRRQRQGVARRTLRRVAILVLVVAAGYGAWLDELHPALERLDGAPPMSRPITIIRES